MKGSLLSLVEPHPPEVSSVHFRNIGTVHCLLEGCGYELEGRLGPSRARIRRYVGGRRGVRGRRCQDSPQGENLVLCAADGSGLDRLTDDAFRNTQPAVSPDGQSVVFASNRDGSMQLYRMRLSDRKREQVTREVVGAQCPAWSPDGTELACEINDGGFSQIAIVDLRGSPTHAVNISKTRSHECSPCWSGDGTQLCWVTDRFGDLQLIVANKDGSDQHRQHRL